MSRILDSKAVCLFLTCWVIYSAHLSTNVVREHYPAFSLVESGSFRVDRYQGLHSDLFEHTDGHWYINNNVGASMVAAIPLLIFDPFLDAIESYSKNKLATGDAAPIEYRRPDKPLRQEFFNRARAMGLDLRFGAATAVTTWFLMAPLSAAIVVLFFRLLLWRGVSNPSALWLSILFAFGTPMFFRSGVLNHNMMLMATTFCAFALLWTQEKNAASHGRTLLAGLLSGTGVLLDYSGAVPLVSLFGYVLVKEALDRGIARAFSSGLWFGVAATVLIAILWWTQWVMFGHPLLPAQSWMPTVNFSDEGYKGFSLPSLDLYWKNLFDESYGLFAFGPILILALIPTRWFRGKLIVEPLERLFILVFFFLFLTFCAANQYSRMQFNTGVRYLMPMVPLLFLMSSDVLRRLPRTVAIVMSVAAIAQSWVITAVREGALASWSLLFVDGLQLPWTKVIELTRPEGILTRAWILAAGTGVVVGVFLYGVWCRHWRLSRAP